MLIEQLAVIAIIASLLICISINLNSDNSDEIRFNSSLEYALNLSMHLSSKLNKTVNICYRSDLKEIIVSIDNQVVKQIHTSVKNISFSNINVFPSGHVSPLSYYISNNHYTVSMTGKINFKNES